MVTLKIISISICVGYHNSRNSSDLFLSVTGEFLVLNNRFFFPVILHDIVSLYPKTETNPWRVFVLLYSWRFFSATCIGMFGGFDKEDGVQPGDERRG